MSRLKFGNRSKKPEKEKYQLPKNEKDSALLKRMQMDYEIAKEVREPHIQKCKMFNRYYRNHHYTQDQMEIMREKFGVDYIPPVLPEPFVQVESQIDVVLPSFQFNGRDENLDPDKAKQREEVVQYIFDRNKMQEQLLDNERDLNKYGDAFWKVSWDKDLRVGRHVGDIVITGTPIGELFFDPSARTIDDCEYLFHSYRMPIRKARRMFGKIINKTVVDGNHNETEVFNTGQYAFTNDGWNDYTSYIDDETIQIYEYYYRDDEGDIALIIYADEHILVKVEKFWKDTKDSGNQMYPIIKYSKVPVKESMWSIGEIEMIIDLVDAADRELATALLNDAYMASDIIVADITAQPEGEEWEMMPGSILWTEGGMVDKVKRLAGISQNTGLMNMIDGLSEKIQQANGNFDSNAGAEPARVTTASGLAQLNERADKRKNKKTIGRLIGIKNLVRLVDWFALEFYTDERIIVVKDKQSDMQIYKSFTRDDQKKTFKPKTKRKVDFRKDDAIPDDEKETKAASSIVYFPQIDVNIEVGEGFASSKAFTFQATVELIQYPVNMANVEVAKALVDLLDLPDRKLIKDGYDKAIEMQKAQAEAEMAAQAAQSQAQQAQAAFAMQNAQGNNDDVTKGNEVVQGGITDDEAVELISSLPEEMQSILLELPDEQMMIAIEEISKLPPEEIGAFFAELMS